MNRTAKVCAVAAAVVLLVGCDEDKKKAELLTKAGAADAGATAATASVAATGATSASPAASASAAPLAKKEVVCPTGEPQITDADLEADIRKKLGKEKGPITGADLKSVKSLNLTSKKSLDELDPCIMPKMTGLRHLYLGPGKLNDLRPLSTLIMLETLRASINEVEDLRPLEKLVQLDALDLGRTHVRDLTPLAGLVNVTELQLDNTQITDLAPLAKMKKLQKLSIRHTNVTDLSPLKGIETLKFIYVEGCAITNLDAVQPTITKNRGQVVTKGG